MLEFDYDLSIMFIFDFDWQWLAVLRSKYIPIKRIKQVFFVAMKLVGVPLNEEKSVSKI